MNADRFLHPGLRFLVVEDDDFQRKLICGLLADLGATGILEAADGRAGLELLHRDPAVDVIICDLEMPALDGFAFIEALRTDPKPDLARLPVIVFTVYRLADIVDRALAAGANGFIIKPLSRSELVRQVDGLFAPPA